MNLGEWNTVFAVPASVVDKHIRTASSIYLKVLLLILRNTGNRLTTEHAAEILSISEDDVAEAIRYWETAGVLSFGKEEGLRVSNVTRLTSKPVYVSPMEISKMVETKPELRFMFEHLETIYGRPVTSTEQRSYIYLHESAGLPADVLVMIAEHCSSVGKNNIRYIEKTALNWADEGIDTHEKAVERIMQLSKVHQLENEIQKCFGIENRSLSTNEKKYIKIWCEEYHFSIDMIKLAYDRMIDGIGRLSFPYLNKILKSWYENKWLNVQDVTEKDILNRSKEKGTETTSYDMEAFKRLGYDLPEIEPEEK